MTGAYFWITSRLSPIFLIPDFPVDFFYTHDGAETMWQDISSRREQNMWKYLALVVVGLLACISFSSRSKGVFKFAFVALSIAGCCAIVVLLLAEKPVLMGSETSWFQSSPWIELFSFIAMISGMAAKYVWDLTEVRRTRNAKLSPGQPKHSLEFDTWDFVQPLLVSGIVFSGVLSYQKELSASALLFSFQNGFFWQTILRNKKLK